MGIFGQTRILKGELKFLRSRLSSPRTDGFLGERVRILGEGAAIIILGGSLGHCEARLNYIRGADWRLKGVKILWGQVKLLRGRIFFIVEWEGSRA